MDQPHVIPSQGDLLGDLLNLDLGPPVNVPQVSSMQMGAVDLLGGGLDSLVSSDFLSHKHWINTTGDSSFPRCIVSVLRHPVRSV